MPPTTANGPDLLTLPDALGRFGAFGGRFVPETLMDALNGLAAAYDEARADPAFQTRAGRTTSSTTSAAPRRLTFAGQAHRERAGGADLYLKREDLNHTGAHKINNAIGQVPAGQSGWGRTG